MPAKKGDKSKRGCVCFSPTMDTEIIGACQNRHGSNSRQLADDDGNTVMPENGFFELHLKGGMAYGYTVNA